MPRHHHAARGRRRRRHARRDPDDAAGRREHTLTGRPPAYAIDEQLNRIVARLPIGVVILSTARLEVVYANVAAQRLFHPTQLRIGDTLPEPWPSFSLRAYAERLFGSALVPDETVQQDGHGAIVVRGVTTRDFNSAAVLLEDVSAAEQRRRAEREFVANAAHELLTPLTGIIGAAHVLETGAKDVPEERERFIGHIARECDRLARISRALLVLARAQSGEQPPRLDVVRLCDLLDDVIATAEDESPVRTLVDCARELTVFVDRDLLLQALENLVRNAARHGSGGLVVKAAALGSEKVTIEISDDSAQHVDPEDLEGFQRRFASGAGRDSGGFGLGLSIARQSIEALGGTLSLSAVDHDGFTARMELLSGAAT